MGRSRQQEKSEWIRMQLLEKARELILEEGLSALSIRRLTSELDYSPGMVYHYFKDKNELLNVLVENGFQQIYQAVKMVPKDMDHPEETIKGTFRAYIEAALSQGVLYQHFLNSQSEAVLKKTALLHKGIGDESPSIGLLMSAIKIGMEKGIFYTDDPELTAQVLWASVYGLVMKLIVEKNIEQDQRQALIEKQLDMLMGGLKK